jgi:hypothetical protein
MPPFGGAFDAQSSFLFGESISTKQNALTLFLSSSDLSVNGQALFNRSMLHIRRTAGRPKD